MHLGEKEGLKSGFSTLVSFWCPALKACYRVESMLEAYLNYRLKMNGERVVFVGSSPE